MLEAVAHTMGEHMQAGTCIRLLSDDGEWLTAEMLYEHEPAMQALLQARLIGTRVRADSAHPAAQVLRSRQGLLVPDVDLADLRASLEPAQRAIFEQFQPHSMVMVPLRHGTHSIGTLAFGRHGPALPAFTPDDLRLAEDLADRAGLAVQIARLIVSLRDEVDARARAEAALSAEHTRVIQLKDEFLATVSHELRTPLISVLGQAELLLYGVYGELPAKQAQAVQNIERRGRDLLVLINDILDYTTFESGRVALDRQPVKVAALCHECLQAVMSTALERQIILKSTLDPGVTIVEGDERRLRQILNNLLSNALKFTPSGGSVALSVQGDAAGQRMTFAVQDTGIGIAERDFGRLFRPFGQLDSRLRRLYEGTGLGLALVRKLAEAHGGSVAVDSVLGRGSRFSVTLPWDGSAAQGSAAVEAPQRALRLPNLRRGQAPLIVLAEDNEPTIEVIQTALLAAGYRVVVARDGRAALEAVRREQPALLLLDIQLPGKNGLEVLEVLEMEGRLAQLRMIALTAMVMPGDRELYLAAGAHAYLAKPVPLLQLLAAVAEQLAAGEDVETGDTSEDDRATGV